MSATVRVKSGRAWATITGPSAQDLEDAVRRILGDALGAAEAVIDKVRADMDRTWPVSSGESLRSFQRVTIIDPDRMRVESGLRTDLVYPRFLKSTKEGKRRDATRLRAPLQTDVRAPVAASKKELVRALPGLIGAALQREVRRGS